MREKKFYHPEVIIGGTGHLEDRPAAPEHRPGVYPCPCCGYRTFPVPLEEAVAFICPVCFWENDVFIRSDEEPSDENHGMTLNRARENFRRFGAVRRDFLRYVRPPLPEEIPPLPAASETPPSDGKN